EKALLQLNEYSNKYGVSLSTLRRRIKAGEIKFEFEQGKYWLPDEPISKYARSRPQPQKPTEQAEAARVSAPKQDALPDSTVALGELYEFTNSARAMMSEIKSAFVKALQEKEEQILELKEEVADLRTLNGILYEENERLKKHSYPEWLEDSNLGR